MEKLKLRAMIQDLAEDIAGSMLQELKVISTEPTPGSAIAVEKLADQVAKEVAEEMAPAGEIRSHSHGRPRGT